jgi:hypothetical protein
MTNIEVALLATVTGGADPGCKVTNWGGRGLLTSFGAPGATFQTVQDGDVATVQPGPFIATPSSGHGLTRGTCRGNESYEINGAAGPNGTYGLKAQ